MSTAEDRSHPARRVRAAGLDDVELWMALKRVTEVARAQIVAEVTDRGALSEPELTVLVLLDRAGGTLRQNAAAAAAGWDRTRLSHLLTRMEERGLLSRQRLRNGVEVVLISAGRDALEATRAPMAAAIDRYITGRLTSEQRSALEAITAALDSPVSEAAKTAL